MATFSAEARQISNPQLLNQSIHVLGTLFLSAFHLSEFQLKEREGSDNVILRRHFTQQRTKMTDDHPLSPSPSLSSHLFITVVTLSNRRCTTYSPRESISLLSVKAQNCVNNWSTSFDISQFSVLLRNSKAGSYPIVAKVFLLGINVIKYKFCTKIECGKKISLNVSNVEKYLSSPLPSSQQEWISESRSTPAALVFKNSPPPPLLTAAAMTTQFKERAAEEGEVERGEGEFHFMVSHHDNQAHTKQFRYRILAILGQLLTTQGARFWDFAIPLTCNLIYASICRPRCETLDVWPTCGPVCL